MGILHVTVVMPTMQQCNNNNANQQDLLIFDIPYIFYNWSKDVNVTHQPTNQSVKENVYLCS